MLQFRDFVPRQLDPGGFFSASRYESLQHALDDANTWIGQTGVDVINVETVALPSIHSEEGSEDVELRSSGEMGTYWHQFIRVWYRG
ncbi:hypothetical protein Mal4_54810 [Maioricimonas rarisocia]|uniref:Uncharacterized protein n=1 Tax=Maioricimonas rarisocia TaxID=2528026 RepID=A0A517ZF73_9PLAN|nr:hypothetical protein [Maioricimonas rarisocia]QDU41116.1 hypothetical protein Mal4_54810 [Maioricimonas rarisocia]